MAKSKDSKKRIFRRRRGVEIPLAVVAGFAPAAVSTYQYFQAPGQGLQGAAKHFVGIMSGYDVDAHNFDWHRMQGGLIPVVAGVVAHKIADKLGINRMLRNARIPFVRI